MNDKWRLNYILSTFYIVLCIRQSLISPVRIMMINFSLVIFISPGKRYTQVNILVNVKVYTFCSCFDMLTQYAFNYPSWLTSHLKPFKVSGSFELSKSIGRNSSSSSLLDLRVKLELTRNYAALPNHSTMEWFTVSIIWSWREVYGAVIQ